MDTKEFGKDTENKMNRLQFLLVILLGFSSCSIAGTSAIDTYKTACASGDLEGCYHLGLAYAQGDGVKRDMEMARAYLQLSCDEGISDACTALNSLSRSGYPEKKSSNTSVHYFNERFGFALIYPGDVFGSKIVSDNGDGITLYNHDKTLELRAYGSWYGDNIREIYRDEMRWAIESGQRVTYKVLKKNWFVLSGVNGQKQTIFYQKSYFKNGKSASFRLVYPIRDKKKYDTLISTINKSFTWK